MVTVFCLHPNFIHFIFLYLLKSTVFMWLLCTAHTSMYTHTHTLREKTTIKLTGKKWLFHTYGYPNTSESRILQYTLFVCICFLLLLFYEFDRFFALSLCHSVSGILNVVKIYTKVARFSRVFITHTHNWSMMCLTWMKMGNVSSFILTRVLASIQFNGSCQPKEEEEAEDKKRWCVLPAWRSYTIHLTSTMI